MQLLMIRHALPVRVEHADGQAADPSLSEVGRQQAEALAAYLQDAPLDAIYASTAARARETAAPLAEAHGLDVATREALLEYDFGASSYIPLEEVEPDDPGLERWIPWFQPVEEDGPVATYRRQVLDAVDEIVATHKGQTVAVVSHGGTINAYLSGLLGLARAMIFVPDYTSISRAEVSTSGFWTLHSLNVQTHLETIDGPLP